MPSKIVQIREKCSPEVDEVEWGIKTTIPLPSGLVVLAVEENVDACNRHA